LNEEVRIKKSKVKINVLIKHTDIHFITFLTVDMKFLLAKEKYYGTLHVIFYVF